MRPSPTITEAMERCDAICDRIIGICADTQIALRQNDRDLQACVDRLRKPLEPFDAQG